MYYIYTRYDKIFSTFENSLFLRKKLYRKEEKRKKQEKKKHKEDKLIRMLCVTKISMMQLRLKILVNNTDKRIVKLYM